MPGFLQVTDLCKSFQFDGKTVPVLQRITFDVEDSRFVAIIGPSGCGKSTLLELIAGITVPDSGSITYRNNDITGQPGFAGYMPQDDLLLPWLSLLDNAILPDRIKHKATRSMQEKAFSMLPDFGLEGYAQHKPWQLSGGMKQRAAFLRTVMTEAEILLLDEPFANLDALTRLQMQKWLLSLRSKLRQTIILVTHDIDEAIRLADTVYVMSTQPGPFIDCEIVPAELKIQASDSADPLWGALKTRLTARLIQPV